MTQCDATVAIVGDGVAGLITFGILRRSGLPCDAIRIYGDSPSPTARISSYARAVGQRSMRSESNGHLRPVDAPGLALADAWQQRSPLPLLQSLLHLYSPPLDLVEADGLALAQEQGFGERKIGARVGRIRRVDQAADGFALYDPGGALLGTARHVVLALGHPGLAWPAALEGWHDDPRVTHAYMAPQMRAGEHIVVLGGGMAAAHTWLRALDHGARVTALHRRELRRQRLNAPRCAFSATMLDNYRQLDPAARRAYLRQRRGGSYPWRAGWEWQLWRARRAGLFATQQGELAAVDATGERLLLHLADGTTLPADRLICATGFVPDMRAHPLIDDLVATYGLPLVDGMLLPDDGFALPELSRQGSACVVAGVLARWALPVADTFMGMKYAGRRFTPLLLGEAKPGGLVTAIEPRSQPVSSPAGGT